MKHFTGEEEAKRRAERLRERKRLRTGAWSEEDDEEEFFEELGIGESEYFSTCEYTMIPRDDDAINEQGS